MTTDGVPGMVENMRKQVRIGVIGCGNWGKNLIRNLHAMGVLVAVSDIDCRAAATFADLYGVPSLDTATMLSRSAINAIVIAVPAEDHAELAIRALVSGKHVFVEKPLAVTDSEADALASMAQQRDRILMVGHVLRYHPCFRELVRAVGTGRIGRIAEIRTSRCDIPENRRRENAMWGFAPHDVSMMLALTGEMPTSVFAGKGKGRCSPPNDANRTLATLRFPSGIMGQIFVSWMHPEKEQKLVVIGERGRLIFDDQAAWNRKLVFCPGERCRSDTADSESADPRAPIPVSHCEPLREECEHFVNCVATGEVPLTGIAEGVDVVRVLSAIGRSMESGRNEHPAGRG